MGTDPKSRIRRELDEKGHTYRSIGQEIGISPQAVSEIVNGRTEGATARYALAAALGLVVGEIWPGSAGANGRLPGRRGGAEPGPEAS